MAVGSSRHVYFRRCGRSFILNGFSGGAANKGDEFSSVSSRPCDGFVDARVAAMALRKKQPAKIVVTRIAVVHH
jgi:hypothetical protein